MNRLLGFLMILVGIIAAFGKIQESKECKLENYKYRIATCNNCFNGWFYSNEYRWEEGLLVAKDEFGDTQRTSVVKIKEGNYVFCSIHNH